MHEKRRSERKKQLKYNNHEGSERRPRIAEQNTSISSMKNTDQYKLEQKWKQEITDPTKNT